MVERTKQAIYYSQLFFNLKSFPNLNQVGFDVGSEFPL